MFILFITDIDKLLYSILKVINSSWVETLLLQRKSELKAHPSGSFNKRQDGLRDGDTAQLGVALLNEQQGTAMESATGVSTEDMKQLRLDVETLFEKFKQMQAENAYYCRK